MKTPLSQLAEQFPDEMIEEVECNAERLSAPTLNDPYNQQGIMEAEEIIVALKYYEADILEPILILAYEHSYEHADIIWEALKMEGIVVDEIYHRVDGRYSCVIGAEDEFHINKLHKTAAEILQRRGYIQIDNGQVKFAPTETPILQ